MFLFFCWGGVRARGGNLFALTGGRWKNWNELFTDIGFALPFWILWEATAYAIYWVLGPSNAKSVFPILPHTALESAAWVFLSITAGFCEELIFRGYLQSQLQALSGSVPVAVLGQGLVFGLVHSYQAWHAVFVIAVLGILYGVLAAVRSNLRANILSHAWSDVFEGWLKFLMFPGWFPH
jgi:membrane protease YdiL (CAAX protease family)